LNKFKKICTNFEKLKIKHGIIHDYKNNKISPIYIFEKEYEITKNINADNILYYFSFEFKGNTYYKVGITRHSVKERYGIEANKIKKILYEERIDSAIKLEELIKHIFKEDLFPLKVFNSGFSETFDRDILNLDI
jgi:hypothetical protein